jgi:hypothetical protein
LGSLFIIVYQTALLREQQAASALPYVMVGVMANPDRTYIVARNTGVGPALIEEVVIRYHGREIKQDPPTSSGRLGPRPWRAGSAWTG